MGELQLNYRNPHNQRPLEGHDLDWYWNSGYSPQYQYRVQDYNGFNGYASRTADPIQETGMHSPFPTHPTLGTTTLQLQPWIMPQVPQWPSMLTSQSTYQASLCSSSLPPTTPVSVISFDWRTSSEPRNALTDSDRERICRYHEKNPTASQTYIASMPAWWICMIISFTDTAPDIFGVERRYHGLCSVSYHADCSVVPFLKSCARRRGTCTGVMNGQQASLEVSNVHCQTGQRNTKNRDYYYRMLLSEKRHASLPRLLVVRRAFER
ncbi:hypothetical protein IG631_24069 [Alternaria alternata]|nr:hypothetical protein IG631_24069 [Alternaria alternata]